MANVTAIEKSIKEFVFSKIQEKVHLDVSSKTISVKHRSKHGSIALSMFWLRVLRHQNNYPMPKYPYKELYVKNGSNKVILKVDNVTVTTFMSTGTLMVQGEFVLEWFVNKFQTILDAYDAPINEPQSDSTVYRQYTESWKKLEVEDCRKQAEQDADERERGEIAVDVGDTVETVSEHAEDGDVSEIAAQDTDTGYGLADTLKQAEDSVAEELADNLALMSLDVWAGDTLEAQLGNLRTCCVQDGPTYVYKLWKSLLHHWFSDPACKVYIVTPFLDAHRLADICNIILGHRLEANLDALYVRQLCDRDRKIFEVKKNVLEKFGSKDQMFLEYKIYSSIIYPVKRFHAKFIGCIKGNEAEVVITSANFHADHFEYNNMETVQYQTMSDVEFVSRFLGPINASIQVQK